MKTGGIYVDNSHKDKKWFGNFIQLTGPRQDVIDFAKSICGKGYNTQLKKAIAMLEADDTYVSLCMTNDVFTEFESVDSKDIRDVFAPLVEKYYRCEFIYYYGDIAHYKPNAIYMTSLAGEKIISDLQYFFIPDSPERRYWVDDPDYIIMLLHGKYINAGVKVKLKNGKMYTYIDESKLEWKYDVAEAMEPFFTSKLTFTSLAELLCDYKSPKKQQEFFQRMQKNYQGIEQVASTTVTQEKFYTAERLENEKICDPTVVRYLDSMFIEKQELVFDFGSNTAKRNCLRKVYAYQDPLKDEFTLKEIIFEDSEETLQIPGVSNAVEAAFAFAESDKHKRVLYRCLTDIETIIVPSSVQVIKKVLLKA